MSKGKVEIPLFILAGGAILSSGWLVKLRNLIWSYTNLNNVAITDVTTPAIPTVGTTNNPTLPTNNAAGTLILRPGAPS